MIKMFNLMFFFQCSESFYSIKSHFRSYTRIILLAVNIKKLQHGIWIFLEGLENDYTNLFVKIIEKLFFFKLESFIFKNNYHEKLGAKLKVD